MPKVVLVVCFDGTIAARPMMCEWIMQSDDQLPEELFEALVRLHAKYLRYDQYVQVELGIGGLTESLKRPRATPWRAFHADAWTCGCRTVGATPGHGWTRCWCRWRRISRRRLRRSGHS